MRLSLIKSCVKMDAQHRKLVYALIWVSLFVIIYYIFDIYKLYSRPLPPFNAFYIKENQTKLIPLQPLNRPILTRLSLIEWAELAAVSVNTYNAANYVTELNNALNTYFTPEGTAAFKSDFINSGALAKVLKAGMIVTAVTQARPAIIYQGDDLFGTYAYKIQVPLLINYQTLAESKGVSVVVTLLVLKIPTWQSASGIGVQQYWINSSS